MTHVFIFILKWLEIALAVLYVIALLGAFRLGEHLSGQRLFNRDYSAGTLSSKILWAKWSFRLLLVLIVGALMLRFMARPQFDWLLVVHLPFAFGALYLAFRIRKGKSGLNDPEAHGSYVFGYMLCGILTALTGILLVLGIET